MTMPKKEDDLNKNLPVSKRTIRQGTTSIPLSSFQYWLMKERMERMKKEIQKTDNHKR